MAQPRYRAIAEELRQQIESGAIPRESRLPTEVELLTKFNASHITIRDAIKLLVLQHLLETRGREGTFVTKARVPFVTRLSTDLKTGLGGGGEEGMTSPNLMSEQGRDAGAGTPKVTVLQFPTPLFRYDRTGTSSGINPAIPMSRMKPVVPLGLLGGLSRISRGGPLVIPITGITSLLRLVT